MKIYLLSLGAGFLVGVIYSLLGVRSPAPPVVALVGLFGILAGEQVVPLAKTVWRKETAAVSWTNHIKPCLSLVFFGGSCCRSCNKRSFHHAS